MTRFLRFCVVGALGFLVDGGILVLCTRSLGMGPIRARAVSFSIAMVITWIANRSWAFRGRLQQGLPAEFAAYASAQLLGLGINFGLYTCLVLYSPAPFDYPLVALVFATAVSMLFNFVSLAKIVFPHKAIDTLEVAEGYTGTDNLEIMSDAKNYNRFLTSLVLDQAKSGMSIVDYGAGIGTFALACREQGIAVHCVEPDMKQAQAIRQSGMSVSRSLAEIPDEGIDLLYTLNVLEHIEDDPAALKEIFRKLKPGGHVLIYVPAFQVLYSSMDRKVGHFRRYTRPGLSRKVREAGFAVLNNRYVDSLGFAASLLYKLVGSESGSISRGSVLVYDRLVFPVSRLLDMLFGKVLGKNVYLLAEKPK